MRELVISLLLFLVLLPGAHAQKQKLSRYEKAWALKHPFAAIKVKRISKRCAVNLRALSLANEAPKDFRNGGREDAFRHIFYMAAFAQKIKAKKIIQLGEAHERGNYRQFLNGKTEDGELPDSLGTVMDLHNNLLGCNIGTSNKNASLQEIAFKVNEHIVLGKALIMKRKANGNYLDCLGNIISPGDYKGKWFIPKCLVSSDKSYID